MFNPWAFLAHSDIIDRVFEHVLENKKHEWVAEIATEIHQTIREFSIRKRWTVGDVFAALLLLVLDLYDDAVKVLPKDSIERRVWEAFNEALDGGVGRSGK